MPSLQLTLYSRQGCHLCDEMHAHAAQALQGRAASLELIDIDTDDALRERYDWRVPVLACKGAIICEGHFDAAALQDFFDDNLRAE